MRRVPASSSPEDTMTTALHGVTPEPPSGSEHYREGWRHGYEQHALDAALPDTLRAVEDIAAVCRAAGLEALPSGRTWLNDDVKVRIVNGEIGWQVSLRDGMGGALVCEASDYAPLPSTVLLAAIRAAQDIA